MPVTLTALGMIVGVLVGIVIGYAARPGAEDDAAPRGHLAAYEARAYRFRSAAVVLGLVLAVLASSAGALGRGLLLAPAVFALTVMGVVAIGELLPMPSDPAGRRQASLDVRSPERYRPRALGRALTAVSLALAVLLTVTTLTASRDDLERRGRALELGLPARR